MHLIGPRYRKVVEATATLPLVGVAMVATTANSDGEEQGFWVQCKGPGCVLVTTGTSIAIGKNVVAGSGGGVIVAAGTGIEQVVGVAMATTTTNSAKLAVCLNL